MAERENCSVLVLVDSSDKINYFFLKETTFSALDHFGIPYEIFDLGKRKFSLREIASYSELFIPQEHLGKSLSLPEAKAIVQSIKNGVGLVNFDGFWQEYPEVLQNLISSSREKMWPVSTTKGVKTITNKHYITEFKERGEEKEFNKPIEVVKVDKKKLLKECKILISTKENLPALIIRQYGKGRIVQSTLSPKIWLNQVFGHANGLDDIFWKSIVWVAKKPFAMKAMPPFVTFQIDDASGAHHFKYLDTFNNYGYIPHVSLFIDEIDKKDISFLKEKWQKGKVGLSAHAFKYNKLIYFDFHEKPYSSKEIRRNFKKVDKIFKRWGIKQAEISCTHYGEYGENAIPLIKKRGMPYKTSWHLPEEIATGVHKDWHPAPYGNLNFIFDYLPGYPDIFVLLSNHKLPFSSRIYLDNNEFIVNRSAYKFVDFLWRKTVFAKTKFAQENSYNDIEGIISAATSNLKLGLESLFFGHLVTHEQRIGVLSLKELEEIFDGIKKRIKKYNVIYKGYDYIAEYAKNRNTCKIVKIHKSGSKVACSLKGKTEIPLLLYYFYEKNGEIKYRFEDIPSFKNSITLFF